MNIELIRADGVLRILPAPPYVVKYLQYSHRSFETVNWKRVNKYETMLLHTPDGEGGVVTLQGYFSKVCQLISKNMDTYTVDDQRTPLPAIDWEAVKAVGLRDYQIDPVIEFLGQATVNSGSVVATGGFGKTHMQAVTYAAFNSLNTILTVPLREILKQTHKKFGKLFPGVHIGMVGDGYNDISSQITLSTFASLKNCALEKCELLMVDEIQSGTGDSMQNILTQIKPVRSFGFTATDKNLFNGADKVLKGLFGDRLIHIEYPEAEEAGAVVPGSVWMIRLPDMLMSSYSTIEAKIKHGIKNCDVRNKLIGEICRLIPNRWQTMVFVEHVVDHLVKLHHHMPEGTKYIHRQTSKKEAGNYALSPKEQNEVIKQFVGNEFQHLICTDAFRAGVDVPNVRVIVQASGGSSEVEILQEAYRGSRTLPEDRWTALGVEPKTHFVLIDFLDNHDESLASMAQKRMAMYKKQGWAIHEVSAPSEIDWFDYDKV